eukprot:1433735-Rhodomonas_salina.1
MAQAPGLCYTLSNVLLPVSPFAYLPNPLPPPLCAPFHALLPSFWLLLHPFCICLTVYPPTLLLPPPPSNAVLLPPSLPPHPAGSCPKAAEQRGERTRQERRSERKGGEETRQERRRGARRGREEGSPCCRPCYCCTSCAPRCPSPKLGSPPTPAPHTQQLVRHSSIQSCVAEFGFRVCILSCGVQGPERRVQRQCSGFRRVPPIRSRSCALSGARAKFATENSSHS